MTKISLLLLISLLLIQCKTKDYLTPHEYTGRILEFGTGGGFTGGVKHFTLLDNGQIFSDADKEGIVEGLVKLEKAQVEQIFDNYDNFNFKDLSINNPGNKYYFLTMKQADQEHKLIWGRGEEAVPKELKVFHNILMKTVKASRGDMPHKKIKVN